MLVEHSFVTTLEESQAMERAAMFLRRVGLRNAAADSAGKPNRKLYRGLPADFIPKKVQLDFDRGRMNAAIAIEPKRKPRPVHSELLLALVGGLEEVLAGGKSDDQAAEAWQAIVDQERRRVRRERIIGTVVLCTIAAAFVGLIWFASHA